MILRILVTAAGLFLAATQASASIVMYSFSGTITIINTGGQNGTPISGLGGVDVGDSFTGSFAYDTDDTAGDLDGSTSTGLFFFSPTSTNTATVNIDGNVFGTPIGSVAGAQTFDNVTSDLSTMTDALDIFKGGPSLPSGWSVALSASSLMHVAFLDSTGTALPSDALPTSFDPADWELGQITISFTQDVVTPTGTFNNVYIEGTINLSPQEVPSPPSALLVTSALACGGIGWRFRRRMPCTVNL